MTTEYWACAALYFKVPVVGVALVRAYNGRNQESLPKLIREQTLLFSIGTVLVLLV